MSRTSIYLDHNATAPLHPAARDAMCAAFDLCGNASSVHAEGRAARATIDSARAEVAAFAGAAPKNVVFTSGGTEALNLVLTPHIETSGEKSRPFDLLLAGAGEHSAVLAGHRFAPAQLELVGLTSLGVLDLEALDAAVARASATGHRIMLAIQAANNETGVMQPVAAAAEIIHAAGGVLICDAVQAAGKIPCELGSLGADAIVFSAHKFGGPKGAGALCFGSGSYHIEDVLLRGGGQERGLRAGTENIAAIAGMAAGLAAAKARLGEQTTALSLWRDEMEAEIARALPGVVFFGAGAPRLPNTSCFGLLLHRSASVAYGFGYGGFRGIVGFGLFVGEGATVACVERDGRGTGAGDGCNQGQPRLEFATGRLCFLRASSCKDSEINPGKAGQARRISIRLLPGEGLQDAFQAHNWDTFGMRHV